MTTGTSKSTKRYTCSEISPNIKQENNASISIPKNTWIWDNNDRVTNMITAWLNFVECWFAPQTCGILLFALRPLVVDDISTRICFSLVQTALFIRFLVYNVHPVLHVYSIQCTFKFYTLYIWTLYSVHLNFALCTSELSMSPGASQGN